MAHPTVSVQLYSVRNALEAAPVDTIQRLAGIGLTQVEAGLKYLNALPGLLEAIHDAKLATPTLTASLFHVDRSSAWSKAHELGAGTVVETFVPVEHWTSLEDVDTIAGELNAAAAEAASEGLRVGYHNHWWELETRFDGKTALDLLIERLDPSVILEVDAYWVAVGGEDPVEFVGKHADRVRYLHLKDGPIDRDNSHQRPAGTGSMPIREIVAAAPGLEAGVIEFDEYDGDVFEAISESLVYLQGVLGEREADA